MDNNELVTHNQSQEQKYACHLCARERGELTEGNFAKSEHFNAHQDYEVPIPGFIIFSARRHILSFDEFSKEEEGGFARFFCQVRGAMRKVLGIGVVYYFMREDTSQHLHLWMLPRYKWMTEKFGAKVESIQPITKYARENLGNDENLKKVDEATVKLKKFMAGG